MLKIYISGKITGTTDYIKRFERAEKALSEYIVINPAKVNAQLPIETTWEEYMQMSMTSSLHFAFYVLQYKRNKQKGERH